MIMDRKSNKKDKAPIKIVQGGATGLVQQKSRSKSYPSKPKKKKEEHIYIEIKDIFKKKYGLDLVLMEGPKGRYSAYDEDSEFIKKFVSEEIPLKPKDGKGKLPYLERGFSVSNLDTMIEKFQKENIKYAVLGMVDGPNPPTRAVILSSKPELIGISDRLNKKYKITKGEWEYSKKVRYEFEEIK